MANPGPDLQPLSAGNPTTSNLAAPAVPAPARSQSLKQAQITQNISRSRARLDALAEPIAERESTMPRNNLTQAEAKTTAPPMIVDLRTQAGVQIEGDAPHG